MAAEPGRKSYGSGRYGDDEMKRIICKPKHESETESPKDWKDIFTSILAWLCIIFLPVTIIAAVILKIKNEIGFWKWIFQGMPNMANHRWYALSVIATVGFCGLCAVLTTIEAVREKVQNVKRTVEGDNEEER